jgi:gluconate kinase
MAAREGHYASPGILPGQFRDLEEPEDALVIDAGLPVTRIVETAMGALPAGP